MGMGKERSNRAQTWRKRTSSSHMCACLLASQPVCSKVRGQRPSDQKPPRPASSLQRARARRIRAFARRRHWVEDGRSSWDPGHFPNRRVVHRVGRSLPPDHGTFTCSLVQRCRCPWGKVIVPARDTAPLPPAPPLPFVTTTFAPTHPARTPRMTRLRRARILPLPSTGTSSAAPSSSPVPQSSG